MRDLATEEEIKNLNVFAEPNLNFSSEDLNCPDNSMIYGYWQSEKYFDDAEVKEILRKEFTLKNPLHENSAAWEKKILSSKCAVSIHFRYGGYITPLNRFIRGNLSKKYYLDCICRVKKICPEMTLFVFSDDLDWAKKILPENLDVPIEFVEGCEKSFEELFSNFLPFLSIIFCVESNSAETAFNLSTTLSQNFMEFKTVTPDFEVIIADISEGDGEKISRRFASNDKVTFLNLDENTDFSLKVDEPFQNLVCLNFCPLSMRLF